MQRQTRSQRHGVGGLTEKWRPDTQPLRRHLIGQKRHSGIGFERFVHLPDAAQAGRNRHHAGALSTQLRQQCQPGLARRPVNSSDRAVEFGQHLWRQLKTAGMRPEKNHPAPSGKCRLHMGLTRNFDIAQTGLAVGAHPEFGQLSDKTTGLGNGRAGLLEIDPGLSHVRSESGTVTRAERPDRPAQGCAQRMQCAQGPD